MPQSSLFVILGASENPDRPSFMAGRLLQNKGYRTHRVSYGQVDDLPVHHGKNEDITVAVFLKPKQQEKYYDYVLSLNPTRIIFNPGFENDELKRRALEKNIKVFSGCTIAMLMNGLI
jgi:predicted CoA-binding protein